MQSPNNYPNLRFEPGSIVAPGDKLGSIYQILPGDGTYARGDDIYSSAVGTLQVHDFSLSSTSNPTSTNTNSDAPTTPPSYIVNILLLANKMYCSAQVLSTGRVILGKIQRVTIQHAQLEIMVLDKIGELPEHHWGMIRKEHVKAGTSEDVSMHEFFSVGDVVVARIISLGDARRCILTTAEEGLGVVRSMDGTSTRVTVGLSDKIRRLNVEW